MLYYKDMFKCFHAIGFFFSLGLTTGVTTDKKSRTILIYSNTSKSIYTENESIN